MCSEEDADDVAVDDGLGLEECDGGDCAGGVSAYSGEFGDGGVVGWHVALVLGGDGACGGVEVSCSSVVAQARPEREDAVFGGVGHGLWCWEGGDELAEAFGDAGDLGLLEHCFCDEGVPGVS